MTHDGATANSSACDYILCGWRVRSAVALPDAMPWTGDDRSPDITIRLGPAPPLVDPVLHGTGPVQVGQDGACRLGVKQIANFLVLKGREVIVEPHCDLAAPEFRAWLLGAALGMLCHQRGLFPLHASCVAIDGRAVALTGRSGAGKSALAAALVRRDHALLADDVCVIDPSVSGIPRMLPSFPRLKLWEDVLIALGASVDGMPRAGSGKRKFHFLQPASFDPSPAELRGIYILSQSTTPQPEQEQIRSANRATAATMLSREIYRRPIGFHLGRKAALLVDAMRIAAAVPVYHLSVRHDLSQLDAVAARVEAHFRASPHRRSGSL